jgi:hypothetical protein
MNFINKLSQRLFLGGVMLLYLSSTSFAEEVDYPSGVLQIEEMIEGFRAVFRRKMEELSENYIIRHSGDTQSGVFRFQSNKPATCYGPSIDNQDEVSKIVYHQEVQNLEGGLQRRRDNVQYWGCYRNIELAESVTTTGRNLSLRTLNQIRKAAHDFSLSDNIQEIHWRLFNMDQEEVASFRLMQVPGEEVRLYFFIKSAPLVTVNILIKDSEKRFVFEFPNTSFEYKRKYSRWSYRFSGSNPKIFEACQIEEQAPSYLNSKRQFISQVEFQQAMTDNLIGKDARLKIIEQFFRYHIYGFPSTAVAVSLGNNQRILNELRLANIRLLSSTDLNLVQNLIQSYIDLIEKGEIKVDDQRKEP